ncbi:MFS sugar transporter-like protein [Delphinella strobiligena]|nr:MFS sugar transporter-like protein [Delphinella strobiligena]
MDDDPHSDSPTVALLGHRGSQEDDKTSPSSMPTMSRKGMLRAYWLGCVVCLGGFLFGYDSGIVGGVLTFKSFERDFGYGSKQATRNTSLANSLQQLGAFLACFAIWPVTHKLGRKWAIVICSTIFCIGAIIQTINTHSFAAFLVGRVISGIGLGGSSVIVPMFSSEMSPKELRGQIGSFYQLFYTFGIFTSYWVDYGVALGKESSKQWQISVGLQLVPAGLLGFGMLTLKESVRWLTVKGRHEEALQSLQWIRGGDSAETQLEMEEIRAGVEIEEQAKEGFQLKEMILVPENLKRTCTAAGMFAAQQATGATAFAYYGPQYFKLLVGSSGNRDLLLTAIFGAVKVAACLTFVVFVAERAPRKAILIGGALFMAACQICTAAVVKTHPAPGGATVTHAGIATIALIYLFVIAYNFSWGPLPWPYVAEIFPTRIREPGVGVGVASQWLWNFVFSISTPYMVKNMGYGVFLLWGIFDLVIAIGVYFFLVETRGLSLEQITHTTVPDTPKLFDDGHSYDGPADVRPDDKGPQIGVQ